MKQYDSVVIGAGPAGLTAALYLARFGVKTAVVEKLSPGGMLLQTYEIENYPGLPKAKGYELADAISAQLAEYQVDRYADEVVGIEADSGGNRVRVGDEWLAGRTVIIASGLTYRKLGLPDEERLTGRGVSFCALCDGNFFRNQVVGVVGGGNAALEESLYLATLVKELHLIHRRDSFRADKIYHDKVLATPNIKIHYNSIVTKLHGENELTGISLSSGPTRAESHIPLSGLFVFVGFSPSSGFLPEKIKVDEQGFIVTDTEMRTSLPGVFAAGDIRSKLCRQVATAVGDGATAANAAYGYLEKNHA